MGDKGSKDKGKREQQKKGAANSQGKAEDQAGEKE